MAMYCPQCDTCGCDLFESEDPADWMVADGDSLGCGCDGWWSVDSEGAHPVHDDDCARCRLLEAREEERCR